MTSGFMRGFGQVSRNKVFLMTLQEESSWEHEKNFVIVADDCITASDWNGDSCGSGS